MPYKDIERGKAYQREYKRKNRLVGPPKKRGVKAKTVAEYEKEATREENGCLMHPSHGAARICFFRRHPEVSKDYYVCHKCDNPKCIEDTHHFHGRPVDNILDSVRKGRHSCFENIKKAQEASPFGTPEWDSRKRDFA